MIRAVLISLSLVWGWTVSKGFFWMLLDLGGMFFVLWFFHLIKPFRKSLPALMKLTILLYLMLIFNSELAKIYREIRYYQLDLNGDKMFAEADRQLKDFEFWERRFYNDLGYNLAIYFAPVTSVFFTMAACVVHKILLRFSVTSKIVKKSGDLLNTGRSINGRNLFISFVSVVGMSITFFEVYFRTQMSVGTFLKIHDYEVLMLWVLCVYIFTCLYNLVVTKLFRFEFVLKLFWIYCSFVTFRWPLYEMTIFKADSFLYMLIPLASVVPAVIIYADNLLSKLFAYLKARKIDSLKWRNRNE